MSESRLYFICIEKAAEGIVGFTLRLFDGNREENGKRASPILLAAKPPQQP